jgi:hypothetical protein
VSNLLLIAGRANPHNRYTQEAAYKDKNYELVSPDSIYSGHSSSQLLDARFSGCRRYLDYLLIRRTLKQAPIPRQSKASGSGRDALRKARQITGIG